MMTQGPETIALRPNERLQYWRHHDLGSTTLLRAHYGPFEWEKHVHDEQVIVMTEAGSAEVQTRKGRNRGRYGSVWVFAPGEYHCGRVRKGGQWQYRALYVDEASLRIIAEHFDKEHPRAPLLRPGLHDDPEMAQVLLRAHQQRNSDMATDQGVWSDALMQLFARYGDPEPALSRLAIGNGALRLAREYIGEHFRDDISIDDLATLCNVSRFHFIRAFRATFGMPPHAYINQVRLQNARKLLLAGTTAAVAAVESGFYDQSRLNHLFKRCYGVTPAVYARLRSA